MSRTLTSQEHNEEIQYHREFHENTTLLNDKSNRGLGSISRLVSIKIALKGTTCYKEVADEIVQELSRVQKVPVKDERSIRRRVYDAINILLAMKFIKREYRTIQWHGPILENMTDFADSEVSATPKNWPHQEQYSEIHPPRDSPSVHNGLTVVPRPFLLIFISSSTTQALVRRGSQNNRLRLKLRGSYNIINDTSMDVKCI
eukprot:jgi/Galph1/724/GphlegSOOS_G5479.1